MSNASSIKLFPICLGAEQTNKIGAISLNEKLILEAIGIAKSNEDNFSCSLLKLKLHVCMRVATEIINELSSRGIVQIIYKPKYSIKVLV